MDLIEDLWTLIDGLDVEIEGINLELIVDRLGKQGFLGLDEVLTVFGVIAEEETEIIGVYWDKKRRTDGLSCLEVTSVGVACLLRFEGATPVECILFESTIIFVSS